MANMNQQRSWRDRFRPIIAAALKATGGKCDKCIRKALKDAYPLSERENYPYQVWLDEIKVQRGTKVYKRKPAPTVDNSLQTTLEDFL